MSNKSVTREQRKNFIKAKSHISSHFCKDKIEHLSVLRLKEPVYLFCALLCFIKTNKLTCSLQCIEDLRAASLTAERAPSPVQVVKAQIHQLSNITVLKASWLLCVAPLKEIGCSVQEASLVINTTFLFLFWSRLHAGENQKLEEDQQ